MVLRTEEDVQCCPITLENQDTDVEYLQNMCATQQQFLARLRHKSISGLCCAMHTSNTVGSYQNTEV